jgi:hypothetical protein
VKKYEKKKVRMSCIERSENNGNKAQGYEQVKHKVRAPRLVA